MAMTPGQKLAKWRSTRKLSQQAAGKQLVPPVTQAAWSEWEADKAEPTLESAFAIETLTKGSVKARDWAKKPSVAA